LRTTVIAVVGSKSSGKTTTIEALTKELTKRGYRIAAVKHVSEQNFTIDTKGKDTWRFAESGAKTIVGVSYKEIATIEKLNEEGVSVKKILQKCKGNDLVILEGFREFICRNPNVPKVVSVKSAEEALEASKTFKPILAFTGPYSTEKLNLKIPYVNVLKNEREIAEIVEKIIRKKFN